MGTQRPPHTLRARALQGQESFTRIFVYVHMCENEVPEHDVRSADLLTPTPPTRQLAAYNKTANDADKTECARASMDDD